MCSSTDPFDIPRCLACLYFGLALDEHCTTVLFAAWLVCYYPLTYVHQRAELSLGGFSSPST